MPLRIAERPLLLGVLLSLLVTGLAAAERLGGRLQGIDDLERLSLDLRFRIRGPIAPGDAVAIVAIDDATLAENPGLAERRAPFAALLAAIDPAEPAAIGVDAILAKPEHLLGEGLEAAILDHVTHTPPTGDPGDQLLRQIAAAITGDRELAATIQRIGRVVLGFSLGSRGGSIAHTAALRKGRYDQAILGARPPPRGTRGLFSLAEFNDAARALGSLTMTEDRDRGVRALPFARSYDGGVYAPLVVPLLAIYDGAPPGSIAYLGTEDRLRIGARTIDLEDDHRLLNYRGGDASFPTYSAAEVLRGTVDDRLRGRIVLIGLTYLGSDRIRSPFAPRLPAIEVHATAIDNILADDPIERAPVAVDLGLTGLLGLLAALLFDRRRDLSPGRRLLGLGLLGAFLLAGSALAFAAVNLWVAVIWPLIALVGIGGSGLVIAYAGEARQRRWLRRSFGQYLGDATLRELLRDPQALALGGARRRLTTLFSDIRGFTTIAESLSPEALVELLNHFLTPMTAAVLERGGYLDKYIGDAIMAVFGAPVAHGDHAARALDAAIAMQQALDALNRDLVDRDLSPLEIGVGINTGEVVVGNMGSTDRFDYTVIGDAVNLASRLEGLTKIYGVRCLVGEATRADAGDRFVFRELDRVRVKGKTQPVVLFELVAGEAGALATYDDLPGFAAALAAYRRGEFIAARAGFAAFLAANPGDRVAARYLERLAAHGDQPPPGWDPATTFTGK